MRSTTSCRRELADAVARADTDPGVHVIVLAGAGRAFCAGYDLTAYAQATGANRYTQEMPWDPMKDYAFMMRQHRAVHEPVPLQTAGDLQGARFRGGRRLRHRALLRHVVMAEDARIGYMPARVWGCPTTAMWVYRLGRRKGEAHAVHRRQDHGREAETLGLVLKAVPADKLDDEVDALAHRMATVPQNQLMMQKLMVNQALYNMGLHDHADDRDRVRRYHPAFARGAEFQAAVGGEGLEARRRRARPGHLRLDHQSADHAEQVIRSARL